jgi:cytochrome c peroxidase
VALGKALFWDMQAGSDGSVACATCHFQAGADTRAVSQLNPGGNHAFEAAGPNHALVPGEYPFHQLANPDDRSSTLLRDRDDVAGSQGVHASLFHDIVLGGKRDAMDASAPDPLGFAVGGLNVRRVTGRNTPSAINAVFNVRNFWDGRANRRFNGRNPFGDADANAHVLKVDDLGELVPVHVSLDMASTASQAVGPPLSDVEMSAGGRTFMKLGKKLLSLQPLAAQEVKADDSVLGPLAVAGGKGLTTNYADMIRAAFNDAWWNSNQVVDGALNVLPDVTVPTDGTVLPTDQYTLMESNFSLFWGLAIAAYEATLVSDDAPFDRFAAGDHTALTRQQQVGMRVFLGLDGGNCLDCHSGPEFSGAAVSARLDPITRDGMLERMPIADHAVGVYDGGFYNIGVRKTTDDIGLGANDPFVARRSTRAACRTTCCSRP